MKRYSASVIANSQRATVKPLHDRRLLLLGFWVPVESIANDATGGRCHSAAAHLADRLSRALERYGQSDRPASGARRRRQ